MKTMKWIVAYTCVAGAAFAADTQLDIVVRDFPVTHTDFENFSEQAYTNFNEVSAFFGSDPEWAARKDVYHNTCANEATTTTTGGVGIGIDGYPMVANAKLPAYLQQQSTAAQLEYGMCVTKSSQGYTQRGFKEVSVVGGDTLVGGFVCPPVASHQGNECDNEYQGTGSVCWSTKVYYTPGMVETYLQFDAPVNGEYDMYDGVHIIKAREACDNQNFDDWFKDKDGVNKRINRTLDLKNTPGTKFYSIDYNYNNGGYFPLDSIDASGNRIGDGFCNPDIQEKKVCETWGPQSLSIFCTLYSYQYAQKQMDYKGANTYSVCESWKANGGPKNPDAAKAVNAPQYLRNYGFTMMGYAKFKYSANNQTPIAAKDEIFEFAGDDDMWIFVDGVLAVDLGGTHLATPGKVNIKTLALNNHGCHAGEPLSTYTNCSGASDATGWGEGSWHHLHFFYADRQTDGSNMFIRTSLAEVAPSKYGQPTITEALAVLENGQSAITVTMNTGFNKDTEALLMAQAQANAGRKFEMGKPAGIDPNNTNYAVLVKRKNPDGTEAVYGVLVTGFEAVQGPNGEITYKLVGVLVDKDGNVKGNVNNGDGIAFNYPALDLDENLNDPVYGYWVSHAMPIVSLSGKKVEGFPDEWTHIMLTVDYNESVAPADKAITRPDFTEQSQKLTNVAGSDGLPNDATGEMKMVPLTQDLLNSYLGEVSEGFDPSDPAHIPAELLDLLAKKQELGTYSTYSSKDGLGAPEASLCKHNGAIDPCITFNFLVLQPFRINVRVFDHMGHFVSQYSQSMDRDQFNKALSAGSGNSTATCSDASGNPSTQMFGNGVMLVSAKMYPVAQSGRKLGTGPYIYQVTIVREGGAYCIMQSGVPSEAEFLYTRTSETVTRGYHRTKAK